MTREVKKELEELKRGMRIIDDNGNIGVIFREGRTFWNNLKYIKYKKLVLTNKRCRVVVNKQIIPETKQVRVLKGFPE